MSIPPLRSILSIELLYNRYVVSLVSKSRKTESSA
jgi:hypothetical protein